MSDICMCKDDKCPRSAVCWRYQAPVSTLQSWFSESPRKGDECEFFIEARSRSQFTRLKVQTEGHK